MSTEDAKEYLTKREVPRLFESLMTGLMYHRPNDHVKYLIDCLTKVQEKGYENVTWSYFVDIRRTKTPLPPITDKNGHSRPRSRPSSRTKTPVKIDDPKSIDERKGSPLPPIPKTPPQKQQAPIVFVMGGPGSGKLTQIQKLTEKYSGWVHLSMGDLLRAKIAKKGTANEKWEMISDLMSRGEMAPEEVTLSLLTSNLRKNKQAKGFFIENYPRNMVQVEEFEKNVGHADLVLLIDSEEYYSTQRLLKRGQEKEKKMGDNLGAIKRRMTFYKSNTLPAIKYYDDLGKVVAVDGDRDVDEISFELDQILKNVIKSNFALPGKPIPGVDPNDFTPKKPTGSYDTDVKPSEQDRSKSPQTSDVSSVVPLPPVPENKDEGRKPGLPTCPIIFIGGGPGSGRGTQSKRIVERYKDVVHLSMGDILRGEIASKGTVDEKWGMISSLVSKGDMAPQEVTCELLVEQMKNNPKAGAFLIEGFPRDNNQLEDFNKCIGGLNFVILLDCEKYYMQTRLLSRGKEKERIDDNPNAVNNRILFYQNNTLPIYKHYEDQGKLVVLDGDRDSEEIFFDICNILDFALYGRKPGAEAENKTTENTQADKQEVQEDKAVDKQVKDEPQKEEVNTTQESQKEEVQEHKKEEPQTQEVDKKSDEPQKEEVKSEEPQKQEEVKSDEPQKQEEPQTQEVQEQKLDEPQKEEVKQEETPKQDEPPKQENQEEKIEETPKQEVEKPQQEVQEEKTEEPPKQEAQEESQSQEKSEEPKKQEVTEEVIEESVTQESANTTGNNVENPSHTEKLDAAAKEAEQSAEGTG